MMCVVYVSGNSGDEYVLSSTLCKYNWRKVDLFVLILARVRRVKRRSISSDLLIYGVGVRNILLLPLEARCVYVAHVCFYVCCSDCVGVCWNVCCVLAVVKDSGVLKYGVCMCKGCDGCCVLYLYSEAWSRRCPCMRR